MPSRGERLLAAVECIASVDGLVMEPRALVEDLTTMLDVYEDAFEDAVASVARAAEHVIAGKVDTSPLKYGLAEVRSYHFQSKVGQGQRADLRLAYLPCIVGIEVIAFGNRHVPSDFYDGVCSRVQQPNDD